MVTKEGEGGVGQMGFRATPPPPRKAIFFPPWRTIQWWQHLQSSEQVRWVPSPPPPCPDTRQVLVQAAKGRKHGVAVFGKARVTAWHVPGNTCCRHKPTLPLNIYNTKRQASIRPRTQEHMELQQHQHFDTPIGPSCSPHKATHHILHWIGTVKRVVPKKDPQVRKQGVAMFGQARIRTRKGGGG